MAAFIVLFALVCTGCSGDENKPGPAEAVTDYLQNTISQKDQSRADLAAAKANEKVKNFWSAKGRYPADLKELERETGPLPGLPDGFEYFYNPNSKRVFTVQKR